MMEQQSQFRLMGIMGNFLGAVQDDKGDVHGVRASAVRSGKPGDYSRTQMACDILLRSSTHSVTFSLSQTNSVLSGRTSYTIATTIKCFSDIPATVFRTNSMAALTLGASQGIARVLQALRVTEYMLQPLL